MFEASDTRPELRAILLSPAGRARLGRRAALLGPNAPTARTARSAAGPAGGTAAGEKPHECPAPPRAATPPSHPPPGCTGARRL